MRGILPARCPNKEHDPTSPHAKALQPQLAIVLAVVFHSDHRDIEDGFKFCKIDSVLPKVLTALRLVPGDHSQTVYAEWSPVKQHVDAICGDGFQVANV